MQPQVISGARAIVTINQIPVAAAFVLNYSLGTSHVPLYTVDSPLPVELAPDRVTAQISLQVYRTPGNDPVLLGIAPPGDGSLKFTENKYISLEIRDKDTDQTVLYLPKCVLISRSGSGNA